MAAPRIVIAFHSTGMCVTQFAIDLAKAMRYSGTMVPAALHEQSCYVDSSRNKLVREFLKSEGTHMLMVDVDLGFEPDSIVKTFAILESGNYDLVYGNYALGNASNSIFAPPNDLSKEAGVMVGLEPNKVYEDVATGGTGWLMARRSLLERMEKECEGPWHWFARDLTSDGTDRRGEDISFGLRVYGLNPRPRIAGTTAILLRHYKQQPFIPEFQQPLAAAMGRWSLAFPNPYEVDKEKYLVYKNTVVLKSEIHPDVLKALELELEATKVASDIREAAQVHGCGTCPQAGGEAHQDGNAGGPAEGLRGETPQEAVSQADGSAD